MSEVSTITTSSAPVESSSQTESVNSGAASEIESKPLTLAQKEKFKLTVDGEEFEEEIDFSDKEGLKKRFQLAAAAKKRMSEAGELKKKAYDVMKAFEENPESMLARLGPKGREIAEKFLLAQIQDEMLSPEEKEMKMTKAELAKYKEKEARELENQQKSAQEEKEAKYAQSFQTTIIEALNKSGLPKTPELVKRMASMMHKSLKYGIELDANDLVIETKKEITEIVRSIIGDSDGDHLINLFGEDVAKKIRMSDLKKLQEKQSQVFNRQASRVDAGPATKSEKGYQTMEEWKSQLDQRVKN